MSNISRASLPSSSASVSPKKRAPSKGGRNSLTSGDHSSGSDAIKVVCRFRPLKPAVAAANTNISFHKIDAESNSVEITVGDFNDKKQFAFDKIFDSDASQKDIFTEVEGVIDAVMNGFNGTIMAYGQTSAGKSFTMEGPSLFDASSQGVISRSVDKLFYLISQAGNDIEFTINVSYLEIYCEKLRDLLNPIQADMKIRESKSEGFIVQDNQEIACGDREGVFKVLELGKTNRAMAPTLMNAESSRSHSILVVTVNQKHSSTGRIRKGKLSLIDLAGSEKVSKTGASGMRLEEAKNINSSLTTLGMVINSLCEGSSHVPYRDSKLTKILMDALGGNSKTALIICCAPESSSIPETVSTLRFGERAKKIENKARVNEEIGMEELKALLAEARKEIIALKHKLSQQQQLSQGSELEGSQSLSLSLSLNSSSFASIEETEGDLFSSSHGTTVSQVVFAAATTALAREQQIVAELEIKLEASNNSIHQLTAEMSMLKDDIDDNKTRCDQEVHMRKQLEQELAAFKSAYRELEERLISVTLESKNLKQMPTSNKNTNTGVVTIEASSSDIEIDINMNSNANTNDSSVDSESLSPSSPSSSAARSTDEWQEKQSQKGERSPVRRSLLPQPTPSSRSSSRDRDHERQENNSQRTKVALAGAGSPDRDDDDSDDPSDEISDAATFRGKYLRLKEEYDMNVQRLMNRLTEEQLLRKSLAEKLDESMIQQEETNRSSTVSTSSSSYSASGSSIFSYFYSGGTGTSSGHRRSITGGSSQGTSSREQQLSRQLFDSQQDIKDILQDFQSTKEAHTVVVEAKDTVMRQLIKRNSELATEREDMLREAEEWKSQVENLKTLLRSQHVTRSPAKSIFGGQVVDDSNPQ